MLFIEIYSMSNTITGKEKLIILKKLYFEKLKYVLSSFEQIINKI